MLTQLDALHTRHIPLLRSPRKSLKTLAGSRRPSRASASKPSASVRVCVCLGPTAGSASALRPTAEPTACAGEQLGDLDRQRLQALEATQLLRYFTEFQTGKLSAIFTDERRIHEVRVGS